MKKTFYLFLLSLLISTPAFAGGDASSATVKIYKAYMSTSGDCSSPVVFLDAENDPTDFPNGYAAVDFIKNPTIGSGSIADGAYKCVIFKMSDRLTFVSAYSDGDQCVDGTTYTVDLCNTSSQNAETGATVACSDNTDDAVWVYFSTYSAFVETGSCEDCNTFVPPASNGDAKHALKLDNEVTLSSDIIGTLVFGTAGKVVTESMTEGGFRCGLQPPDMSFRVTAQ